MVEAELIGAVFILWTPLWFISKITLVSTNTTNRLFWSLAGLFSFLWSNINQVICWCHSSLPNQSSSLSCNNLWKVIPALARSTFLYCHFSVVFVTYCGWFFNLQYRTISLPPVPAPEYSSVLWVVYLIAEQTFLLLSDFLSSCIHWLPNMQYSLHCDSSKRWPLSEGASHGAADLLK